MGIEIPQSKFLILDGATGTVLQQQGLSPQGQPELLNLTEPGLLDSVYKEYIATGSQVIYANTFGANGLKPAKTGHSAGEVVGVAIVVAKKTAADTGTLVALDVGPLGELLEPMSTPSFERAYDLFHGVAEAGAKAGVDLIVVETMTDLYEAEVALLAAKEAVHPPVFVIVSFDAGGRAFTGCTVASIARTLEGLGADAIGLNCLLGPDPLAPLPKELCRNTCLPVITKSNAGLSDPVDGHYDMGPEGLAQALLTCVEASIPIINGCCGTSPGYIHRLTAILEGKKPVSRHYDNTGLVCAPATPIRLNDMRAIGGHVNPTRRKCFQQTLLENDLDYILDVGAQQEDAGANIPGVNVGFPGVNEVVVLPRVVKKLQSAITVPLQLDSSSPDALEAGLWVCNGEATVNSVNGEPEVLERVLPIVKKYSASAVGLTLDKNGIPKTTEERVAIVRHILQATLGHGIPRGDVWVDCLTLTVPTQREWAAGTLKAVRTIREEPGLQMVLDMSNISFDLPNRKLITQNFLVRVVRAGLTLPITNPNQTEVISAVAAYRVLSGEDRECRAYVVRFAAGSPAVQAAPKADALTLDNAVIRRLEVDVGKLATKALETEDELSLVENHLIPALDKVGGDYDKSTAFLPQLLSAAQAAQAISEVIRSSIAAKGSAPVKKGKLIVAAMQSGIHDIGKNTAKTVLGNYGYEVSGLGRDVLPEAILRAVQEQGVRLVGLSTLMATILPTMEKTIRLLHTMGEPPVIFASGTVVISEYTKQMNADYYAKDAHQSVEITRRVMG